jgi:hypothetical protein
MILGSVQGTERVIQSESHEQQREQLRSRGQIIESEWWGNGNGKGPLKMDKKDAEGLFKGVKL